MPLRIKESRADIVVRNDGSREDLQVKMEQEVVPDLFRHMKIKIPLASQRS